jgi:hypothetical protein
MIGLLCFAFAVLASPFKSKLRLQAENAALRHQLIVLRRKLRGRVLANSDRWFFVQLYRWANSADRKHHITRPPWRTSSPLRPGLSFRYTQVPGRAVPGFFISAKLHLKCCA